MADRFILTYRTASGRVVNRGLLRAGCDDIERAQRALGSHSFERFSEGAVADLRYMACGLESGAPVRLYERTVERAEALLEVAGLRPVMEFRRTFHDWHGRVGQEFRFWRADRAA